MIYFFQSLIINLLPDLITITFCFSLHLSLRTNSMGKVTAKEALPTLVIFLIFVSPIFLVGMYVKYYVIDYIHYSTTLILFKFLHPKSDFVVFEWNGVAG